MDENCIMNFLNEAVEEGKIVTYRWLSHNVSIHTNVAKQYLYKYGEEHKGSIFTTYFICGTVSDEGEDKVLMQIVPEDELTNVKTLYKSLFGVHVYSIQKTRLKDPSLLYTVDSSVYNGFPLHEHSALRCGKASVKVKKLAREEKKPENELKEDKKPQSKPEVLLSNEKKSSISNKEEALSVRRSPRKHGPSVQPADAAKKSPPKQTGKDNKTKSQTSAKTSAKSSLGAMFAKQSEKQKEKAKAEPVETKSEADEFRNDKKQPDKTSTKPKARRDPAKSTTSNQSRQKPTQKRQKDHQVSSDEEADRKSGGSGRPQKKRQRKVRQRVMRADFSSSEEEEEGHSADNDGEDEAKASPNGGGVRGPVLESPPESPQAPPPKEDTKPPARNKRKVAHKKTFLDDDGFMVTETVMESASESETEEVAKPEAPADKNGTKPSPKEKEEKKQTPPKKNPAGKYVGKQASLTSFFKKK